jgi:hypothetical protein
MALAGFRRSQEVDRLVALDELELGQAIIADVETISAPYDEVAARRAQLSNARDSDSG